LKTDSNGPSGLNDVTSEIQEKKIKNMEELGDEVTWDFNVGETGCFRNKKKRLGRRPRN
jgi:hypothetical protein